MTRSSHALAGRRAIAAFVSAGILVTGVQVATTTTVTAAPIAATTTVSGEYVAAPEAQTPPSDVLDKLKLKPRGGVAGNGQGTLTASKGEPGGLIAVHGKGYFDRTSDGTYAAMSFKLNDAQDPNLAFGDQTGATSQNVVGGVVTFEHKGGEVDYLPGKDGTFDATLRLPENLAPGWYWVRNLAGTDDGKESLGKYAWFEVVAKGTLKPQEATPTTPAQQDGSQAAASVTRNGTSQTVKVTASGFTPSTKVTATIDGKAVELKNATADDKGALTSDVTVTDGLFPAGVAKTIALTDGTHTATAPATGLASATFANGVRGTYALLGSTQDVTVSNLSADTKVTEVKAGDTSLWSGTASAADGKATLAGVKIPNDTKLLNSAISVTYSVNGTSFTEETGYSIRQSNEISGTENFDITTTDVKSGLYQTVYSAKENAIFVSRAVGRPPITDSSLIKLDADTLEVKKEADAAGVEGSTTGEKVAAYGLGLDDELGYVWVTNTRQNTVSVYEADDLSLVKVFDAGSANHARDIVVDPATHKAYVSIAAGNSYRLEVFDGTTLTHENPIEIADFGNTMSLHLNEETCELFTISLTQPKAAKIDLRDGNKTTVYDLPADKVSRASGVTFDPKERNLYIASQGTGNTLIYNVDEKKVVGDVATGAGSINAAFDPKTRQVFVSNFNTNTISVISADSHALVGQAPGGNSVNHVDPGAPGVVYAVNKSGTVSDSSATDKNTISRIAAKGAGSTAPGTTTPGTTTPGTTTPGTTTPVTTTPAAPTTTAPSQSSGSKPDGFFSLIRTVFSSVDSTISSIVKAILSIFGL
ncbi:hypothetical protein [Corynebacterium auris]|uniref:hypothetical protein n=1 Tax=Corynebacterium auris TaxID=44750 RepID=UPI0025B4B09B|nr:hypothetical protein [Corynebacterium auris]WJY68460.1 hypothetical protein CAURIS_07825 [Corynebacterium auris]